MVVQSGPLRVCSGQVAFAQTRFDLTWCELDHDEAEATMRIADVLRNKGRAVATITPDTSVSDLLTELATHNIGAMVVVSSDGLAGIVSERDVVRKLHEHGADLLQLPVSEIMTTMVATCAPSDTVNHLNAVMTTKRVRHIPVLENGELVGIVSIGDVVKQRMEEMETEQRALQDYITRG
jgi:CBS domain-containing protein